MFLFLFQILRFAQDDTDGLRMTGGAGSQLVDYIQQLGQVVLRVCIARS